MKQLTFLIFVFHSVCSLGQGAQTIHDFAQVKAFEEFQQGKYHSVIGQLSTDERLSKESQILKLLSELKTGKKNSAEIENWLADNEKHPINSIVNYHLGEYFFSESDSLKAKRYLKRVVPSELAKSDRGTYGYLNGVIQLRAKNYKRAKSLFKIAESNDFEDLASLNYYTAYASYQLGDFETAMDGFEKVRSDEEYGTSAKFFIAKMLLDEGEVSRVLELSKNELSDEKSKTNSGFHQLIGEAYTLEQDVYKADAYFQKAIDLHPDVPSAALYYQAGVSKFKLGKENEAVEYLTASGIQGGEYAQLSAFQLGRLFLKKQDYEKSLSAYIEASVSANSEIKEESLYHAAKINAQLGNFAEAINYANDYLRVFDNQETSEDMQDLIAQSYLRTSNYDLAIEHLQSVGLTSQTQQEIYQKVTFQKAIHAFNDAAFNESKKWFNESIKFRSKIELTDQAYYHLAEVKMRQELFSEAIDLYQKQSKINHLSYYGLGYAYYNMQKYSNAIPHFRRSVQAENANVSLDSKVRLADCLFANKSYQEALDTYEDASNIAQSPYLIFQKGMTLKNLDRVVEAKDVYSNLFNSQKYGDDALFQVGMIHFELAEFGDAEKRFTQVISRFSQSPLVLESLLNRAISRRNLNKYDESQEDYELILTNNIESDLAINAILGLQELEQLGLKTRKLTNYISDFRLAHPESGSLELIEFEAAKRLYFNFSYEEASSAFENYLKEYPSSGNKLQAKYFLGDSYFRINDFENALKSLDELKFIRNSYTGRVLSRLGQINEQLGDTTKSEEAYLLLKKLNLTSKDNYNALKGLMDLYYTSNEYNKAIAMANEILASDWKPINGDQEAIITKARSYHRLEQYDLATSHFQLLADGADVYAAESNYGLGFYKYDQGDYEESLERLFELNNKFGGYPLWIDKSYLLIAKNYVAKDEIFQAKATLRSIIQHSENEAIKSESKALLSNIETSKPLNDTLKNED